MNKEFCLFAFFVIFVSIMTIANYICDLLYRYDCVILPEFGAFLTKRIGAHLSSEKQLIYPPQKQISFNQQIVSNDGLLANYIAGCEKISFEKSCEKLNYYVQQLRKELEEKSRLSLSEIGVFTKSFEDKLIFEPLHTTNYLPEAFGLPTVQPKTILRETFKKEVEVIEEKVPIAFTPEKRKQFGFVKYAAAAVLLFGLFGVGFKVYENQITNYNNKQIIAADEIVEDSIQSASFVLDITNPLPSINLTVSSAKKSVNNESEIAYGKFHIVAGAFREYKNMEKKLAQLKRKGYTPRYIGANKYGLHQVVYNSYFSRNEALNELRKIKRSENASAWLLIQKVQ